MSVPYCIPSFGPSHFSSSCPSVEPSAGPSSGPLLVPLSASTSSAPSSAPSSTPSSAPSSGPSSAPSSAPSLAPLLLSSTPSSVGVSTPSFGPSTIPLTAPVTVLSSNPSNTCEPSVDPSEEPSVEPSVEQSNNSPLKLPSNMSSRRPSKVPLVKSSIHPSLTPTKCPSTSPNRQPHVVSSVPTLLPSQHNLSLSIGVVLNQGLNNASNTDFTSTSTLGLVYQQTLEKVVYQSFNPNQFSVAALILSTASPLTNQRKNANLEIKSTDTFIQCSVQLDFGPSSNQGDTLEHRKAEYTTQLSNQITASFISGNFSRLFKSSCLTTCGGITSVCTKCNMVRFLVPQVVGSVSELSSIPSISPTFKSNAASSASSSSLTTSALVGVIFGVLLMAIIVIIILYVYYGHGKRIGIVDNIDADIEFKKFGDMNDNDSLHNMGSNEMMRMKKKNNGITRESDPDFFNMLDEETRARLKGKKNGKANVNQNGEVQGDEVEDVNSHDGGSFSFFGSNSMMGMKKKKKQQNLRDDSNFMNLLDDDTRSKLKIQKFDSDLKRTHFPSRRFESVNLSFTDAHDARPSKVVFDDSNPMSDYQYNAAPPKLHRPVSIGLINRYTAVFDYIDTFLQLKSEKDLENEFDNPIANGQQAVADDPNTAGDIVIPDLDF